MRLSKGIYRLFWVALFLSLPLTGCTTADPQPEIIAVEVSTTAAPTGAEAERDEIFSLAAYAVVYKDWQTNTTTPRRGHNIGSILVNENNEPVAWARNCIAENTDGTQHGEVRVMQQYIQESGNEVLDGYSIYTTLEPCIMCTGMMSMVKVAHTVYGQTDGDKDGRVGYGRAIERIKLDSRPDGYAPYPRTPKTSEVSDLSHRIALDQLYLASEITSITDFLLSDEAQDVYAKASEEFYAYEVVHEENEEIYTETKALLETVD